MEIVVKYEGGNCIDDQEVHRSLIKKWKSSLERISKREGYIESKGIITFFPSDGINFLSVTCKAELKGITKNGRREINLFLKHIVPEDPILNLFDMNGIYLREIFMYNEFSDVINALQTKYNVPDAERFKFIKCYDYSTDAIIFDDMSKDGFQIKDRMKLCSLDYMERAIETLAKFHSLSFVLSNKMPDFYSQYIKTMNYLTSGYDCSNDMRKHASKSIKWLNTEDKKRRFSIYCETLPETVKTFMKTTEQQTETKVLCHGDYRVTNLLVLEKDGAIADLLPIDYQLVNYGNPAQDVIFFMYGATDRAFRRRHQRRLQCCYHAAMRRHLRHYRLDVDLHYPMKAFQKDYEDRLGYGLVVTALVLPVMMATKEYASYLVNGDRAEEVIGMSDEFKERLNDSVDEFIDLGLL